MKANNHSPFSFLRSLVGLHIVVDIGEGGVHGKLVNFNDTHVLIEDVDSGEGFLLPMRNAVIFEKQPEAKTDESKED